MKLLPHQQLLNLMGTFFKPPLGRPLAIEILATIYNSYKWLSHDTKNIPGILWLEQGFEIMNSWGIEQEEPWFNSCVI